MFKIITYCAFVCAVLLGLPFRQIACAQSDYGDLIKKGEDLSYAAQFDDAENTFSKAIQICPDKAEAYFNIAQLHLWTFLGTDNPAEYKAFMQWYDEALAKEKKIFDKNPNDFRVSYIMGDTYMLRAMAEVTDHSYLAAFFVVRSASKYFQISLESNPECYDAYRGIGEIHYFLDFIPGVAKWFVSLVGLDGNKARGFAEIRLAYQRGSGDKIKSSLSLAEVYSDYVAEYDSAEILMRQLVDRYPRNPMFNYHFAVVLIKRGDLLEAEKYLDAVLAVKDPRFAVLNNLSTFLKGDIYFKLNDFRNAIKFNEIFLKTTIDHDYTGIASYRLGVSYRAIGNEPLMKKYLFNAENGNQEIYDDAFAKRESEVFLEKGISHDELMAIEMENCLAADKFQYVYETLAETVNKAGDDDLRSLELVILSEAAIHLGKCSEGIRHARMADSLGRSAEPWVRPRSWYLIALGDYYCGDFASARSYLAKAKDTDEYSKNNIFFALINKLERKLAKV